MLATLAHAAELPDAAAFSVVLERGDVAKATAWLEAGLPPDFLGETIGSGLMIGAWEGNLALMEVFLAHGADVNQVNTHGETALLLAAWKGQLDVVRWLIAHGARVNREGREWSALHYAAFAGHGEVVRYLLTHGAAVDAPAPNGSTPLMMAAREGQEAVAKQLLGAGAQGGIVNDRGENAVVWAMRNNNPAIARAIVGSPAFSELATRPADDWGRAVRSRPLPDRADRLLAQARALAALDQREDALKTYHEALEAIRQASRTASNAAPRAATVLTISAKRGSPTEQSAGLRYATPASAASVASAPAMPSTTIKAPIAASADTSTDGSAKPAARPNDAVDTLLRRARLLEAAGHREAAMQAYRQAAILLRQAPSAAP